MQDCLFCKLIAKEIPTKVIYEDDDVFVFNDIHPRAQVHLLIIPKLHIASLLETNLDHQFLLGKLMLVANQQALLHKLQDGYKIQINTGLKGGQEIFHLHLHVLGNQN
ncbi:MAG: hypothetical protein RLZZ293_1357 [Pseudomonadota bacterium]|jgi:histidine triad (HIT) family protein